MARFPKIQSPCPYKGDISDILENDVCRLCKREVFDLTAMSDVEQERFFANCGGEVCVSYSVPLRAAVAASLLVAAGTGTAAFAGENPEQEQTVHEQVDVVVVTAGGIRHPENITYIDLEPVEVQQSVPEDADTETEDPSE